MIDPQDPDAYRSAMLDWAEPETGGHADMLDAYRALIRLRRDEPELADPVLAAVEVDFDPSGTGWWCTAARCGWRSTSPATSRTCRWPAAGDRAGHRHRAAGNRRRGRIRLAVRLAAESAAVVRVRWPCGCAL